VVTFCSSDNTAQSTLPSFTDTVKTTFAPDLLVAANTVEGLTSSPGNGAGFTPRFLTVPDGNMVEDRIATVPGFISAASSPVNGAWGWVMQMVAFRGANSQPADNTAPSVTLTSPGGTGTVTVTANVSDNSNGTGVAGVLLLIDGIPYGTADTAPPYTFLVDTKKFANGTHTLIASAWDYADNTATSSPVSVNFSILPGKSRHLRGYFRPNSLPFVTVNTTFLPTGEIYINEGSFG
jgi:hypothetical protein